MKNKYKHSFAGRLTRWVMLVLLLMMSAVGWLAYYVSKTLVVELIGSNFHYSMTASTLSINNALQEVSVAVENNVFDIERHLSQPEQLQPIVERIVRENPRLRSIGISFTENYYPQKGRTFCPYAWRNDSLQVEASRLGGTGSGSDYLDEEWFRNAVAADSAYWSKPFVSSSTETPLVAYLRPIHDSQGRVVAVLGADLSLDFMTRILARQDSVFMAENWSIDIMAKAFSSYVVSHEGIFYTHPEQRRILKGNLFSHIKDIDSETGYAEKLIGKIKEGKTSRAETDYPVRVNCQKSFLFYTPISVADWTLVVTAPEILLELYGIVVGVIMLAIIAVVLMVTFFVCRLTIRRAAHPLRELASTADQVAQGQFDTVLPTIKSRDEIHLLRDSFDNMQHSLATYVEELRDTTAAKASIESELNIAHNIQMSMLPKIYPAYPDRHDIDIFGQLTPAKAVGGDLYDFFIRDERLFFCVGDVSGKGVPASLVMAVTRSLFRNITAYTMEADRIVNALNEALSGNNDTNMFVTLFVGILDLSNGLLHYSNAGHDMPLMIDNGSVSILPCDPNIPVGVMPGWTFTVQQVQMQPGATIFLYTDGLNEAENADHRQFGMDRVEQTAKGASPQPEQLIATMTDAVHQFVGEAEQSDDLTMLAIRYIGSAGLSESTGSIGFTGSAGSSEAAEADKQAPAAAK